MFESFTYPYPLYLNLTFTSFAYASKSFLLNPFILTWVKSLALVSSNTLSFGLRTVPLVGYWLIIVSPFPITITSNPLASNSFLVFYTLVL